MPGVTSAELAIVANAIIAAPRQDAPRFEPTPPAEKMRRNDLTGRVHFKLTLGLAKAAEVSAFLREMAKLDPRFPERLKTGFVNEYEKLKKGGTTGDSLFEALASFANQGFQTFELQAAGIATLAYLFEACDVFEP